MSKQSMKQGEKILFGIFGIFLVVAIVGYVAMEAFRLTSGKQLFPVTTSFAMSPDGLEGSRLFREKQCTTCHRALRNGTNLMGRTLDGIGSKLTVEQIEYFLQQPERAYFERYSAPTLDHALGREAEYVADLPDAELHAIAVFLSELKSEQGSPSAPQPPPGRSQFIDNMVKMFAPESWREKYNDIRDDEGKGQEQVEQNVGGH